MAAEHTVPYAFVSYASVDRERVMPIVTALQTAGVSIWIDHSGIPGGARYGTEIAERIEHADVMILMCSSASLASRNVRQELTRSGAMRLKLEVRAEDQATQAFYTRHGFCPEGLEEHVYDGSGNRQSDTFYYSLGSHLLGSLDFYWHTVLPDRRAW